MGRASTDTKKQATVVRAVTFPVATVHERTWQEFGDCMRELWRQGTRAANWCVQEYARRDNVHEIGQEALPKMPCFTAKGDSVYLQLPERFPEVSTATLCCIARRTLAYYQEHRLAFWLGRERLPLYRYPFPYPITKPSWTPLWLHDERPAVRFHSGQPRKQGNGQGWTLVLAGGPGFRRQLGQFGQIMADPDCRCEMAIYRQSCGDTHHAQGSQRGPGGHQTVRYRTMVKLVARFPRRGQEEATGCLLLRTDPEAFWVAEHDGRVVRPWVLNDDQTQNWREEMRQAHLRHRAWLQRMGEDMKLERRLRYHPCAGFGRAGSRPQMEDAYTKRCNKHRRRVNTWVDQATAMAVNYCVRRKVAGLFYDDTNQDWMPSFPWSQVRTRLRQRCEAEGIYAGGTLEAIKEDEVEVELVG